MSPCITRPNLAVPAITFTLNNNMMMGAIDIFSCLQSITESSPEIISNFDECDYAVYSTDYTEPGSPLVGHGMLSWILFGGFAQITSNLSKSKLKQYFKSNSQPKVIEQVPPNRVTTGRVCSNIMSVISGIGKEMLEVRIKLVPLNSFTQRDYVTSINLYKKLSASLPKSFEHPAWMNFVSQSNCKEIVADLVKNDPSYKLSHVSQDFSSNTNTGPANFNSFSSNNSIQNSISKRTRDSILEDEQDDQHHHYNKRARSVSPPCNDSSDLPNFNNVIKDNSNNTVDLHALPQSSNRDSYSRACASSPISNKAFLRSGYNPPLSVPDTTHSGWDDEVSTSSTKALKTNSTITSSIQQLSQFCFNCGSVQSCAWRKVPVKGKNGIEEFVKLCNPCGIWYSTKGEMRPSSLWEKESDNEVEPKKRRAKIVKKKEPSEPAAPPLNIAAQLAANISKIKNGVPLSPDSKYEKPESSRDLENLVTAGRTKSRTKISSSSSSASTPAVTSNIATAATKRRGSKPTEDSNDSSSEGSKSKGRSRTLKKPVYISSKTPPPITTDLEVLSKITALSAKPKRKYSKKKSTSVPATPAATAGDGKDGNNDSTEQQSSTNSIKEGTDIKKLSKSASILKANSSKEPDNLESNNNSSIPNFPNLNLSSAFNLHHKADLPASDPGAFFSFLSPKQSSSRPEEDTVATPKRQRYTSNELNQSSKELQNLDIPKTNGENPQEEDILTTPKRFKKYLNDFPLSFTSPPKWLSNLLGSGKKSEDSPKASLSSPGGIDIDAFTNNNEGERFNLSAMDQMFPSIGSNNSASKDTTSGMLDDFLMASFDNNSTAGLEEIERMYPNFMQSSQLPSSHSLYLPNIPHEISAQVNNAISGSADEVNGNNDSNGISSKNTSPSNSETTDADYEEDEEDESDDKEKQEADDTNFNKGGKSTSLMNLRQDQEGYTVKKFKESIPFSDPLSTSSNHKTLPSSSTTATPLSVNDVDQKGTSSPGFTTKTSPDNDPTGGEQSERKGTTVDDNKSGTSNEEEEEEEEDLNSSNFNPPSIMGIQSKSMIKSVKDRQSVILPSSPPDFSELESPMD